MMTVETIGRIRRAHLIEGESIRGIARRLRVSRQVVRRAIASETGEFHYERSVQPLPKLGSHVADLNRLLEENERRPRRERLTLMRIWEELRGIGFEGGYDAVRRYGRRWQRARDVQLAEAYVPLVYAPGEAFRARLRRWCSTPTIGRLSSSRARPRSASTTT
jgi:transposase